MATVINYAEAYQSALAKAFTDNVLTSADLWNSPSNGMVNFNGAKHIKVPRLSVNEGRRDRTRRTISNNLADYSNDWDPYELKFDREWEVLVDPVDVDETNMVTSIANITDTFNRTQKAPEMDRYMYSKLFQESQALTGSDNNHTESLDAKNVLEAFDTMMANFDEKRIPQDNRVLYVTPTVFKILKSADAANRAAVITGAGKIDRAVYSLDDVTIKRVASDLMQTQFDFTVGSKQVDSAQQINMFLIWNGAQIAPQKYAFAGLDNPNAANSGNYLYYERSYGDVFLLKHYANAYEVFTSAKATGSSKNAK